MNGSTYGSLYSSERRRPLFAVRVPRVVAKRPFRTNYLRMLEILGEENVFSPNDWGEYFGITCPIDLFIDSPVDLIRLMEESHPFLPKFKIRDTALLFNAPYLFDGRPANLARWRNKYPLLEIPSGLEGRFMSERLRPGWHLVLKGVPLIEDMAFGEQLRELKTKGLIPDSAVEAVFTTILCDLKSGFSRSPFLAGRTISCDCNNSLISVESAGDGRVVIGSVRRGPMSDIGLWAKWF